MPDGGNRVDEESEGADAIGGFRQGSLVDRPPLVFVRRKLAPRSSLPVANSFSIDDEWEVVVGVDTPRFGVVTTQTCDIVDHAGDQVWIQLAPVRNLGEQASPKAYQVPLTSDALPEGRWAADLRIEIPVEKGALAHLAPIDGFASEEDEVAFAIELGRRRDRAALHDHINDILYRAWKKKIANNKNKAARELAAVYAVRLRVAEGLRTRPLAVQMHFYGRGGPLPPASQEWIEGWWDTARTSAENADPSLNLMPSQFHDGASADLELYDQLIPLQWQLPGAAV